MITKLRILLLLLFANYPLITTVRGQSPAPIIVQAMSPDAQVTATAPPTAAQVSGSPESAIKLLEEIKAKNAEILSKQEATLQQLDELQQNAEQLKIYAKRG